MIRKPSSLSLLIVLSAVLFVPAGLLNAQTVVSDDLEVTFEAMPLFNQSNVSTGDNVARTVSVTNNGSDTEAVYTSAENSASTGLAEVMELSIVEAAPGPVYFNDGFDAFFSQFPVSLGSVGPGDTRTYIFTASLPTAMGNEYQGRGMSFDLVIGFEGGASVSDGGGGGRNDDEENDVSGEIAGESTSTVPSVRISSGFPFEDFIGEVFGATTEEDEEIGTSTKSEPAGLVANVASAGVAMLDAIGCTFLWLTLLAAISMSWSMIEDRLGKLAGLFGQFFTRNAVFTIAYVIGLLIFELLGILEMSWWIFAGVWTVMVSLDYWSHKHLEDSWSPRRRNFYFAAFALGCTVLGLFTPLLCVWMPFVVVMLVSMLLLFLDE